MNISISPIQNNVMMFRANQKDGTKKVEKKQINPQIMQENKTKILVSCFAAGMMVLDVLYFVMKRKFKHDNLNRIKSEAEKIASVPRIKDIYELIKESPESFGPDAQETMDRLTKGIKPKVI